MNRNSDNRRPPSPRSLPYLTWLRLTRVMQKFRRLAEAEVQETGFSTAQFAILFELLFSEGISQQELADMMELTKGNITQLLEKLERDGLVKREREGRMNRLHLTQAGRALAEEQRTRQEAFVEKQMAALSVEEQAQLLTLLRKLDKYFA